jgi:hypothetical protein
VRKFDATGTPLGTEFPLASSTTSYVPEPSMSMTSDGRFLVTWYSPDRKAVVARRFDASAAPIEDEFPVNDYLADRGHDPNPVMDDNGSFVVVWNSAQRDRDGSGHGVFGRRFCDAADTSCDLCAGFDDSIDDDADGVPNGCDPCTLLVPGQTMDRAKLRVAYREPAPGDPLKSNTVRMTGSFVLPGGFASLQPQTDGMRVRIESRGLGQVAQLSIDPGSPGWTQDAKGWKYSYNGPTLGNGMRDVVLMDRSAKAPNLVKIKLKAAGGLYAMGSSYIPMRAIITFGDTAAADAGLCAETAFVLDDCKLGGPNVYSMACRY